MIDIVQANGDPTPDRPDLQHDGAGETICQPMPVHERRMRR
ncbi:MAG: hypothetical protein AB7O28_14050 [Vicinamibacterales bacterium]